jgi:hypothetical protein
LTKQAVDLVCQEMASLPKLDKTQQAAAEHATDFEPLIYNIWKQQEKTKGSEHFGNSEVRWLDNLLYLYTKPFDVVIDPSAGGGSTIDPRRKTHFAPLPGAAACRSDGKHVWIAEPLYAIEGHPPDATAWGKRH